MRGNPHREAKERLPFPLLERISTRITNEVRGINRVVYDKAIFRRLSDATEGCRTMQQCREGLTAELPDLAGEIATPGTDLNRLLTRT